MIRQLFRTRFFCITDSPLSSELGALRRQLVFRSKHLGVRELDLLVGTWADRNVHNLSETELYAFNTQVLKHETPDLLKKVLGQAEIHENEPMVRVIR
jgi:antitoxin CptB